MTLFLLSNVIFQSRMRNYGVSFEHGRSLNIKPWIINKLLALTNLSHCSKHFCNSEIQL